MNGFIKLHRSMLEWEWMDNPVTVQVWVYCLLRANYEMQRWHGEIIQPGQFVTSLGNMSKDLGITKSQLRTALNHLISTQEIAQSSAQHATLITIEKWALYQGAGEKAAQLSAQNMTSRQHLDDISLAPIKEYKEIKEEKERKEIIEKRAHQPEVPEEVTRAENGETFHYINGVLQYTPEETKEILQRAHEQFAPIKAAIMKKGARV